MDIQEAQSILRSLPNDHSEETSKIILDLLYELYESDPSLFSDDNLDMMLTEREQSVLGALLGVHGYQKKNIDEVVKSINISSTRCAWIVKRALLRFPYKPLTVR